MLLGLQNLKYLLYKKHMLTPGPKNRLELNRICFILPYAPGFEGKHIEDRDG